jgi:hypothetical protein
MPAGRGPCGHVHTCRANACSHMAGAHHQARARPGTCGQCGPSKNNCPHGPHACAGAFWRGRSVDNVGTLDHCFKSVGYNIVYTYCIHFTFFTLFIFLLSTWSTIPIFSGAPCGQIRPRAMSANLPTWSTFCKLIVYIGFWRGLVNQ